jgi:plasmid stabilization system protein ParE
MTSAALPVVLTRRAERQLEIALNWWKANRPAAPHLFVEEMTRAVELLGVRPAIGARARGAPFQGVRRVLLEAIGYHIYYRVRPVLRRVEILAIWHARRGSPARL